MGLNYWQGKLSLRSFNNASHNSVPASDGFTSFHTSCQILKLQTQSAGPLPDFTTYTHKVFASIRYKYLYCPTTNSPASIIDASVIYKSRIFIVCCCNLLYIHFYCCGLSPWPQSWTVRKQSRLLMHNAWSWLQFGLFPDSASTAACLNGTVLLPVGIKHLRTWKTLSIFGLMSCKFHEEKEGIRQIWIYSSKHWMSHVCHFKMMQLKLHSSSRAGCDSRGLVRRV